MKIGLQFGFFMIAIRIWITFGI